MKKFTKDLVLTLTAKEPQGHCASPVTTLWLWTEAATEHGRRFGTGEITYKWMQAAQAMPTIDENGVLTQLGRKRCYHSKAGDVDYSEITSAPFVIMIAGCWR